LAKLQDTLNAMIKNGSVATAFVGSGFGHVESINTNLIKVIPDNVE
jgi:hypothetical protein